MLKLKVTGMTCGHCEAHVRKALAGVPGVTRVVSVDRGKKEAVIEGAPDPKVLVEMMTEEGYPAEVVP